MDPLSCSWVLLHLSLDYADITVVLAKYSKVEGGVWPEALQS